MLDTYLDNNFNSNNPDNREPDEQEDYQDRITSIQNILHETRQQLKHQHNKLVHINGILETHTLLGSLTSAQWRELKQLTNDYTEKL